MYGCLDCVKNFINADFIECDGYKAVRLRFEVSHLNYVMHCRRRKHCDETNRYRNVSCRTDLFKTVNTSEFRMLTYQTVFNDLFTMYVI